ncbi:hypothetical protein NDK47_06280 [Brevibacillus ruminantium]|uniref:Amidase n=1 Tax=Brevibacillus ruminantium TaxID=2950604 RepID=A0ABY4WJD3_9BACL|nr:hypothetical protein [Brevibacillus ruminantium]USG66901.1 hypothetical protein NDK47_06280 [Brevibacillus ruminantium]
MKPNRKRKPCKRVSRYLWGKLLLSVCTSVLMLWLLSSSPPSLKATWIWNTALITEDPERILAFADQQGVNRIYLHIDRKEVPRHAYQAFISEAKARKIQVDALAGDPAWSLVSRQDSIAAFVEWVHAYNRSVSSEERFTGIHVDIEPHVHPNWRQEQEKVKNEWLTNMELVIRETKKDPNLEVSADIPFWTNQLTDRESESVSQWLLGALDHVTLMAYRDHVEGRNGVLDISSHILAEAGHSRQKVVIGLNVLESREGGRTTFYEEDTGHLQQQLDILERRMKKYPAYAGFAIHDYEHWDAKFKREQEKPAAREKG